MSMPFDATLKQLGEDYPGDFLATFDAQPAQPIAILNVDLSTVTTAADLVIGIGKPLREIVHIDFQSAAVSDKHRDILVYNALLHCHYGVPVHSLIILLRPSAAHSNLNGQVCYAARPGRGKMEFGYEVVRLWEWPVEGLLAAGTGVLPLAMLGRLPEGVDLEEGLTAVAQRIMARLDAEAGQEQTRRLLTAAFVLTGLRLKRDRAMYVFREVRAMRDSDTYLAIMDEGREDQVKDDILVLAGQKFGEPDATATARLAGITDLNRLKRMVHRLWVATSWQDLLDTP